MNYKISKALVYGSDNKFSKKDIFIKDGIFIDGFNPGDTFEEINAQDLKLIPGLTDIHFHGCMGHDFCEGSTDVIQLIADYEESQGVTTICPATMTFPEEKLIGIARAAADFPNEKGAALVGINMEGPFISYEKRGAQNPEYIQAPDAAMFKRIQEAAGGLVKLVDIAPETEGAFDFIDKCRDEVVISLAHTTADFETAAKAFAHGVRHVTHLYNAMNTMNHRNPGPIFAAADTGFVEVELICDNIHVHPSVVRNTLRMFTDEKVIFISDTMEAVGMKDGDYELGGLPVKKTGNRAELSDGTIAGSATNLMDCMKTAVLKMDIPLETAVKCAAVNPAKSIGIFDRYGSIEPGKCANIVGLDEKLETKLIFNRGVKIKG